MILQHVLIVCDTHHRHCELFTRKRCEFVRFDLLVCLVSIGETTLLVGGPLQQVSIRLHKVSRILTL